MAAERYIDVENLNYCGKEAQEIFAKDVYSLDLRGYGITLMDGVKGKRKIYLGDMDNAWQAYSCPFSPDGQVTLSEDYIEPVAIKVNKQVCYDEFWDSYLVEQTSITLDGGIPASFSDWYFTKLRAQMAKEYQQIFWNGDTGQTGYLGVTDGVINKLEDALTATTNIIEVETFTVDNILEQVEAVIMKGIEVAANAEAPTDGHKVFMNYADVNLLRMALGQICCPNSDSIFSNYAKTANGGIQIFGFDVVPTMQARNTVIFGPAKNLVLGFDTYDSHLQYKLVDMRETTLDNMFRVAAISNIGVGVAWPELFTLGETR